jgi:ankyrin repeat protein
MDLIECIKKGNMEEFKSLLANHPDLNAQDRNGMTPLMTGIDYRRLECVEMLIKSKADLDKQDKYGQTALMLAAGRNLVPVVKWLVAAKADLNLVSRSRLTALGFALDNKNREAASILRRSGAR